MHKVVAVVSITCNPCSITSIYVSVSYFFASANLLGSLSYTPSTFLANKITSASISAALNAAAVSVEKYGFPEPAPKITTLPFSKCLTALLLINGSAISFISIAV